MELISNAANGFMKLFQAGGNTFMGWVTGIIPMVICLMTAVNSVIKIVGEERVENFAKKITRFTILRYTLLPVMAVLFLGNPMCYSFGRFVDEKYKPAYYDSCVSFLHPVTGLFPHANPAELFVYTGISAGLIKAGYSVGGLAVRYFVVGIIVILIRGIVTERIYSAMCGKAEN
ncbi:MAG: PTS glucitol/sorbitol transporter subunit IIC [Anaerostipes sp.]|nr:PTS glucitol/sorbitol transporter subunit IIC [Anaerostipes sp.]